MRVLMVSRPTLIWLILVIATLCSFETMVLGDQARVIRSVILVIAFAKATLVGLEFMELRHAPAFLRLPFLAWAMVICTVLLVLSWAG